MTREEILLEVAARFGERHQYDAEIALDVVELALSDPLALALDPKRLAVAVARLPKSARDAMRVFLDACETEGVGGG